MHVSYGFYNQIFGQSKFWIGSLQAELWKKIGSDGKIAKDTLKRACNYSMLLTMNRFYIYQGECFIVIIFDTRIIVKYFPESL